MRKREERKGIEMERGNKTKESRGHERSCSARDGSEISSSGVERRCGESRVQTRTQILAQLFNS